MISVTQPASSSASASASKLLARAPFSAQYFTLCAGQTTNTQGPGQDILDLFPFMVASAITLDRIGVEVTAGGTAGSVGRLGIYSDSGSFYPGALLGDYGTVVSTATGTFEITISQALAANTVYWAGCVAQVANAVFRGLQVPSYGWLGHTTLADATANARNCWRQTGVTGALPANFTSTKTPGGDKVINVVGRVV